MSADPAIILDLDNCIADDAWRIPLIDWAQSDMDARYHAYHACAYYDEPHTGWIEETVTNLGANFLGMRAFVLTSRPARYAELTQRWLAARCPALTLGAVMMRNVGDHRPSVALKRDQIVALLDPNNEYGVRKQDILFAADDRADICQMYMELGIAATQQAIHDRTAERAPFTVPELLCSAAATYEQRNAVYGDNYKHFGHTMQGLFPAGLQISSADAWNRLGLFVQLTSKLSRYAANMSNGGHVDSAHDASVYAAMLQEISK